MIPIPQARSWRSAIGQLPLRSWAIALRAGVAIACLAGLVAAAGCTYDAFVQKATDLSGWSATDAITVRETPRNPLADSLNIFAPSGPSPTPRTMQLLRRYDLADSIGGPMPQLIARLQEATGGAPEADQTYAVSELAYIGGKQAERAGNTGEALDMFGFAVAHAYFYLFDSRFDATRNPYDPQFRRACDLYNQSLESLLRTVQKKGGLRPGLKHRIDSGHHQYEVSITAVGNWHDEDFDRFEFVSDYEIGGLTNHYHTVGLGVPLIAIRKTHGHFDGATAVLTSNTQASVEQHYGRDRRPVAAWEKFYPPGLSFPVTALLKVHPEEEEDSSAQAGASAGRPAGPKRGYRACALELIDPLVSTDVQLCDRLAPLESDLSTPLAYFLNQPEYRGNSQGTLDLLRTDQGQERRGLMLLEPYDPRKIPVVFVHGLWSTPITWIEMYNDLRSQKDLRDKYQFWFYRYPTGQPFWISAAAMRYDLAQARRLLDPEGAAPNLDRMVLIGHSMGGLVSKLQTVDSGDEFWKVISDRSFDDLKADPETREKLRQVVYFQPNPSIQRVITIATPHRGSNFANPYTRWVGRSIIRLPEMFMQTGEKLLDENPEFFRNTELFRRTTSIDSLAPDSPIIPATFNARPAEWVTYHNVVGLLPEGQMTFLTRFSGAGDGVVGIESARWQQAVSEVVVPAEHSSVHRHPRTILEVQRILREHLQGDIRLVRQPGPAKSAELTGHAVPASEGSSSAAGGDPSQLPEALPAENPPTNAVPAEASSPQAGNALESGGAPAALARP